MYVVFIASVPGGVIVGDSGLCCCGLAVIVMCATSIVGAPITFPSAYRLFRTGAVKKKISISITIVVMIILKFLFSMCLYSSHTCPLSFVRLFQIVTPQSHGKNTFDCQKRDRCRHDDDSQDCVCLFVCLFVSFFLLID